MLSLFEVRDLPLATLVRVSETTPLSDVLGVADERAATMVVVVEHDGRVRGVAPVDALRRLARHAPCAPLGGAPTLRAIEVAPAMCLVDAVRAVSASGVGALLVKDGVEGSLITREALLAFDSWEPLLAARTARLAAALSRDTRSPASADCRE